MSLAEFRTVFLAETEYVEFKTGIGHQPLQDAIVAFSNSDGGVILIGVRDDGAIDGRELTPGNLDAITQVMGAVRDPGRYTIREITIEGRRVIAVSVARRVSGFAQTSNGRVLVRRGTQKVPLFGDDLRRLLNERSLQRFEEHDSGIALDNAPEARLRDLSEIFGWTSARERRDRLRERGLLLPAGDKLTIGGALYVLDDPAASLGKAFIEILRFPSAAGDYDRRVEVRGPLHEQVRVATETVAGELGHELVVLGLQRHEIPRLPVVVLREAIANAVAHRSYEMSGTAIRIEMRPDEVRITSPGSFPEPVTEENLRTAQAARNLNVIRVLRQAGLAEDAGRGIDVMVDSMRSELLDAPRFRDRGHAVEVSLPVRSAVTPQERAWVREVEARGLIEPADRLALVHAARGETLTNARVRELLAVDSSEARNSLHRLRDAGFLFQRGKRGGASYTLANSIGAPAGLRLTRDQLAQVVLEMAREEPVTNARVRLRTGLDRTEALRLLDELVTSGNLRRVGERRGTRYLPVEPSLEP
jgi:ATP-dependent DNA helicase RecG